MDSGVNAKEAFLRKVESVSVEFTQGGEGPEPWQFTTPEVYDFAPEAALASVLSYTDRSGNMELRWTIRMENGDVIRLYQRVGVSASARINFTDCRIAGWRTGVLCYSKIIKGPDFR